MIIFNSYVSHYQRLNPLKTPEKNEKKNDILATSAIRAQIEPSALDLLVDVIPTDHHAIRTQDLRDKCSLQRTSGWVVGKVAG